MANKQPPERGPGTRPTSTQGSAADAAVPRMRFTGFGTVAVIAFAVGLLAIMLAAAAVWATSAYDPKRIWPDLQESFWSDSTSLPALVIGIVAALVGAVGATLGTYFVSRRIGAEIQNTSIQQALWLQARQQEIDETARKRALVSQILMQASGELRELSRELRREETRARRTADHAKRETDPGESETQPATQGDLLDILWTATLAVSTITDSFYYVTRRSQGGERLDKLREWYQDIDTLRRDLYDLQAGPLEETKVRTMADRLISAGPRLLSWWSTLVRDLALEAQAVDAGQILDSIPQDRWESLEKTRPPR